MASPLARLSTCFYVQIRASRLTVTNTTTGERWDQAPLLALESNAKGGKTLLTIGDEAKKRVGAGIELVNPFAHPRTLISDFSLAEKLLQEVFKAMSKNRLMPASPAVIMQPLEKLEGGLTQIEIRAMRELALGAGARDVLVREGSDLTGRNIDFAELLREEQCLDGGERRSRGRGWMLNIIFVAVAVFLAWRFNNG
ncbi:rod shape-determining protein MreB [Halopseudomonas laoshanensis]|uniref:Rod shape-determining protein MreB n=1 Tax=Halopseudomonas laoshanensis TaxID=2268758 RepID=A0A7V7GUB0_9GAMM|nr:rod shape-determining protein [Halopseudomonas laoshanensis]KAA0695069.1 rod shape-determining protein MreB [Halopseudomonas laoshanensis]